MHISDSLVRRAAAAAVVVCFAVTGLPAVAHPGPPRGRPPASSIVGTQKLIGDRSAVIYSNGVAQIEAKNGSILGYRALAGAFGGYRRGAISTDESDVQGRRQTPPFAPDRVVVAFAAGMAPRADVVRVPAAKLAAAMATGTHVVALTPVYTADSEANRAFTQLGADRLTRIAGGVPRERLQSIGRDSVRGAANAIDVSGTYVVHITSGSVWRAIARLRQVRSIAYAAPDYAISPMNTQPVPISSVLLATARRQPLARRLAPMSVASTLPDNYAVTASAQSFLNADGVNAIAAYDEIEKNFGQLPGQGEIVTNVSLGDLDDSSVASSTSDSCGDYVRFYGPTTHVIGGQRFLDLPSMPLIPAYTAAADGTLSGSNEVCGVDPFLGEIGLDFSVMAPLPHALQRANETGSGFTDLLGVAPGASYRLVVPGTPAVYTSDLAAAFMGAALQMPSPNVITASLGPSGDLYGFPGRFVEEDPLMEAVIAYIVGNLNEVVCISSNDGTRTYTNAAIGPSGGSAPTDRITGAQGQTRLDDVLFSTAPSKVIDSGSIDVGGTTLDDVALGSVAETRFTGGTNFSSGFGSRVDISAPADNIVALRHAYSGYDSVGAVLEGGTSAAAPMVAAAAAVVLQVARLTHHQMNARDIRKFLHDTANAVRPLPQADRPIDVGPRLDLRRSVETLLGNGTSRTAPAVPRVAIAQRQGGQWNLHDALDATFVTNTDPGNIDMQGPYDSFSMRQSGEDALSAIAITPDWESLPPSARFELFVAGKKVAIATTPSARLLPAQILAAAGLPAVSGSPRTVTLTYRASHGSGRAIAESTFSLTFGPWDGTSELVPAPHVDPVQTGSTMQVGYDLSLVPPSVLNSPTVVVSYPGRVNPITGNVFFPAHSVALTGTKGTVSIPIDALQGDGIYGVGIVLNQQTYLLSDFAYTRVSRAGTARPAAPLFVMQDPATGATYAHASELPYNGTATLAYDVTNVPRATGAIIEVSAAGPNFFNLENPFNNPNGSEEDQNGNDGGSVYRQPVSGTKGTINLGGARMGLTPAMAYVVRAIPVSGLQVVGEASDVSFLSMDGIVPAGGAPLASVGFGVHPFGYAIDPRGTDAFLTSNAQLADGSVVKSVQHFDQKSGALGSQIVSTASGCDLIGIPGNGIFGDGVGLLEDYSDWPCNPNGLQVNYQSIPSVATAAAPGGAWTPPLALPTSYIKGSNSISGAPAGVGAFVTVDSQGFVYDDAIQTFTSNVSANTFSAPVTVDAFDRPIMRAFDYDGSSGLGYLAIDQYAFFGRSNPTSIVQVDYKTGVQTPWSVNGCGYSKDFVLDSTTHKGILSAATTRCSRSNWLQILGLQNHTAVNATPPAESLAPFPPGPSLSADPVNHLFFVELPFSADAGTNNNALSTIDVLDEAGNERAAIEKFNFFWWTGVGNFDPPHAHFFQVNGHMRRGFVLNGDFSQIVPFSY